MSVTRRHELPRVMRKGLKTYLVVGLEGLQTEFAIPCSWVTYARLILHGARKVRARKPGVLL